MRSRDDLRARGTACVAAVGLVLAGCATTPDYPNPPLAPGHANASPVVTPPADPKTPFILMAFSGGGSRAAALGLAVLDELNSYSYHGPKGDVPLADTVKIISSVSGGSVIAAWFGLVGAKRMDELKDTFLKNDNMATLEWMAGDPITWVRLLLSRYTRIDALREIFDDPKIFNHGTFADLSRPGAPFLILNSTDMASGETFEFTPQQFNDICSDLNRLPISVGVAASAAFPVALSPMSLKNYSGAPCAGSVPADKAIIENLEKPGPKYINLPAFKRARYSNALRHGQAAYRPEDYLHLLDGGLADNQGAGSLGDALFSPNGPIDVLPAINLGEVKRIVVISVNARSDADNQIGTDPDVPGLFSVINAVIGIPIDSTTAYSNENLATLIDTLSKAGADANAPAGIIPGNPAFADTRVYGIPIDFDQFHANQSYLRDRVKAIGTSWTLSAQELADTMEAGRLLLRQHPCFQRLLKDLGIPNDKDIASLCNVPASGS